MSLKLRKFFNQPVHVTPVPPSHWPVVSVPCAKPPRISVITKCRQSLNLCWQLRRKSQIITRKCIFSACNASWRVLHQPARNLTTVSTTDLCCFVDIWKSFASSNARSSYNTNVHSIVHSPVFTGISWTSGVDARWDAATAPSTTAPTTTAPNTTRRREFVPMETSKSTFFG